MKSFFLSALAAGLLAATAPASAEDLIFMLTNNTDVDLNAFYASPVDVGDWEEDILGRNILERGESVRITIADGRTQCEYDLRMEFVDGEVFEDTVDLCETGSYTVE